MWRQFLDVAVQQPRAVDPLPNDQYLIVDISVLPPGGANVIVARPTSVATSPTTSSVSVVISQLFMP